MAREVSRRTIEGKWVCGACGSTNLGRYRLCQSCGAPRGTTKVDLPDNPEQAPSMTHDEYRHLADAANLGHGSEDNIILPTSSTRDATDLSDWVCEYCGASNGSWHVTCLSCGNPREGHEVTYHEITRRSMTTGQSREDAERDMRYERQHDPDDTEGGKVAEADKLSSDGDSPSTGVMLRARDMADTLLGLIQDKGKGIAIAAGILALLLLVVWAVTPHPRDITPESFDWSRNIGISELRTVKEDDWSVPTGGRVYDQRSEYHHDRKVHDGWHDEEYTDYERRKTGTRTWTEYEDNGDGSYDAVTYEEDVYEDVPVTKTRRVEDYHYEPVYATKYYYEIERWKHARDVPTSGNDQKPYWGEVVLSDATGEHGTGKEKEDGRTEEYGVTCEDGQRYMTDEEFWHRLEKGGKVTVLVHMDGHIEEYKQ